MVWFTWNTQNLKYALNSCVADPAGSVTMRNTPEKYGLLPDLPLFYELLHLTAQQLDCPAAPTAWEYNKEMKKQNWCYMKLVTGN